VTLRGWPATTDDTRCAAMRAWVDRARRTPDTDRLTDRDCRLIAVVIVTGITLLLAGAAGVLALVATRGAL